MSFQPASQRDLIHLMENRDKVSTEAFSQLLDEIVQLNGCGWELGPDPENPERAILAFSSLGNQTILERIREEMNLPITRNRWSVVIGIPPRIWDRYFQYTDTAGKIFEIEGSYWRYRLNNSGNTVEILLDPSPSTYPGFCEELARILCVGELGEQNIVDFVSDLSCVKLRHNESRSLSFLREDFANSFPTCHYMSIFRAGADNGSA